MAALTEKRKAFVREYLIDMNASQAAIRAGYSSKTAASVACELLRKPDVAEAIAKAIEERRVRNQIDADYVLNRLREIDEMDVADILDNVGNVKPVHQWPKVWRTSLSGFDLQELMSGDTESVVRKIKWPDKVKNLELLGKHVDVQAFKDSVDHNIKSVRLIDLTGKD